MNLKKVWKLIPFRMCQRCKGKDCLNVRVGLERKGRTQTLGWNSCFGKSPRKLENQGIPHKRGEHDDLIRGRAVEDQADNVLADLLQQLREEPRCLGDVIKVFEIVEKGSFSASGCCIVTNSESIAGELT